MYRKHGDAAITPESCTAQWYAGEQMDWNHAVSVMFKDLETKASHHMSD